MDPEYGRTYDALYREHWWWRAREEMLVKLLRDRQPLGGWRSILDVGCGNGVFFDRLSEFGEVEGVESCSDLVDPHSPHADRIRVRPFDASFQPGRTYSLILMLDVLEHVDAPADALRHALRLLEPRGLIVITVPAFLALWTSHDVLNNHRTRFTKSSFRRVAATGGMRVIAERYFFHWLAAAKLAARVSEKLLSTSPNVPRVPATWINRTLYGISRVEQHLLRAPFGSSLLVLGTHAQH